MAFNYSWSSLNYLRFSSKSLVHSTTSFLEVSSQAQCHLRQNVIIIQLLRFSEVSYRKFLLVI